MISMNHYGVLKNPHQGPHHKVLCICSAGCLRSPTAAEVLSRDPFNFNTRSAGIVDGWAIVPVTVPLLLWADEVVCMTDEHYDELLSRWAKRFEDGGLLLPPIRVLDIPDHFAFRDPELQRMIAESYPKAIPRIGE